MIDPKNVTLEAVSKVCGLCTGSIEFERADDAMRIDLLVVENERLLAENKRLLAKVEAMCDETKETE